MDFRFRIVELAPLVAAVSKRRGRVAYPYDVLSRTRGIFNALVVEAARQLRLVLFSSVLACFNGGPSFGCEGVAKKLWVLSETSLLALLEHVGAVHIHAAKERDGVSRKRRGHFGLALVVRAETGVALAG